MLIKMDVIHKDLVNLIMEVCEISEPVMEDISPDSPLVGPDSPLGLDSLDAVEVAVAIQTKYNKRITDRNVMASLRALAEFIGTPN